MDVSNAAYRQWWTDQVIAQLQHNENDGLFADSCSVPSFFGSQDYQPPLPEADPAFEADWTARINGWMSYVRSRFGTQYLLIPNAGYLTVGRDQVDYSLADGVMVEGIAQPMPGEYYPLEDWQLQMDRILALARQDKVLLLQAYLDSPSDIQARLFALGSYLLVRGRYTYINLDIGEDPEWFPEYAMPLGAPTTALPASIDQLRDTGGAYVRTFAEGIAVVNPGETSVSYRPPAGTWHLALPVGGGMVTENGSVSVATIQRQQAPTTLTLQPHSGAILLRP